MLQSTFLNSLVFPSKVGSNEEVVPVVEKKKKKAT